MANDLLEPGLIERLQAMQKALTEVEREMSAGGGDYAELGRRHSELAHLVALFGRYKAALADLEEAELLAESEPEFDIMAKEKREEAIELALLIRTELNPTDPDDHKDVIIEVRAAAGGDEAAIWAGDLLRMYERYADRHGFRTEPMESSESEAGGFSRVTVAVKGKGAYSRFKYEGGVHRVQRVPKTEAQGRIHTSTATVAVLPEATEVEVEVDPNDVRVDVFRSTGPGGQSVNTTDSAVRLTHVPTGLVVTCQDEKSQLQNKEKAFRILRARLYQMKMEEQQAELSGARRAQVGTGGRSEKIRTYNFKESRVTDHRIGLTVRRLDQVLEGDLDELVAGMSNQ
ncbi:MAG TPA: peptide chain release factor 1 [Acidimicrobiia bacterium]|nr:peptide chain release factor 1 [Acidimicrobiia bacterium]